MIGRPDVQRLPWNTIAVVLASAVIVAWAVGFVIGLFVNFFTVN
jgi:hypothetical protein